MTDAKKRFDEALGRFDSHVDEFDQWEAKTSPDVHVHVDLRASKPDSDRPSSGSKLKKPATKAEWVAAIITGAGIVGAAVHELMKLW